MPYKSKELFISDLLRFYPLFLILKMKQQNNRYGLFSYSFVIEEPLSEDFSRPQQKNDVIAASEYKIILVTVKYMNILDVEEMAEVEKLLLKEESHLPYIFIPLETSLMATLQDFTSSYFLPPTQQIHQQTRRIVTNARNIKSVNREDPNSIIKMFNRSVFAIIFPTSSNSIKKAEKEELNGSLLETVKCSLYSKDLNFNHINNKKMNVDNLQAKSMMSKFFHSLEVAIQLSNAQKIRYIECSLEKNQLLQQLFILFYRIILGKLYVDGADDYECPLHFQEAITNLIEYFDINYRNIGELFLVPQQNYFLAAVDTHLVLGEYVQSGGYKGKESLKTTDEKLLQQSLGIQVGRVQSNKKNAVVEADIKLFNFILESGGSSHNLNKDLDAETPHFKDSYQFAFGRKRKDEEHINKQQEIKKQFQKFFMSSQAGSIQEGEPSQTIEDGNQLSFYPQLAGLPLRLSQYFQTRPRDQSEPEQNALPPQPSFFKKSTFNQSMIDELESQVKDQPKINPENHHKNIVVVKGKTTATFSPQISNNMHCAGFSNFINDAVFFDREGNVDLYKSSSGQNVENFLPCLCEYKWVQKRIKRNKITSKVVQFVYFQSKTQRAPKFVQNLKYSQNLNVNNTKVKEFPKESSNLKQYPSNKEIRKPSLLHFLKKNRQAGERSHSSHSRSKRSVGKKSPSAKKQKINHFQLDKQTINRINDNCNAYSTIITKNPLDLRPNFLTTKSATKMNEKISPAKIVPVTQSVIKNFDSKYLYHRPAFGTNWQMVENAISPKIQQRQVQAQSGMFQSGRNQKVRVYAPVNIIAPTVYFNGVTDRGNRVTFTVNNEGGPRERDMMGLKMSDRHLRTETNYYPRQRMANPQLNRYI